MENLVTANSIMEWFSDQIAQKNPIDPNLFLEGALKLSVLLQSEQEILFSMEQEVARIKESLIQSGKTVAYAKTVIEATDEYRQCRVQKAKIERAIEFIRISKQYSRTASDLMKSGM